MDDSGWRCRVRWVVVRPAGQAVLLAGGAGTPALPEVELPGQVWTAEAEATAAVARELVGLDVALLWCVEEHEDRAARVQRATLAVAPRSEAVAPPGARWAGRGELAALAASGDGAAAAAAGVLDSIMSSVAPPIDRHMAQATAYWLRRVLAGLAARADAAEEAAAPAGGRP